MASIRRDHLVRLCREALLRVGGADPDAAQVLADATAEAELVGNRAGGVAHLFDYLDGYAGVGSPRDRVPWSGARRRR